METQCGSGEAGTEYINIIYVNFRLTLQYTHEGDKSVGISK
jgi:hypothetical protein